VEASHADRLGRTAHPAPGSALTELADADDKEPLDDYVEPHVHGGVCFARDVEALVLDPCFRGSEVEAEARLLGVPVQWHHGFRASVEQIAAHPDYRGPDIVKAATGISSEGVLDARIIGAAVREGVFDGQVLKRVWHCTAASGTRSPITDDTRTPGRDPRSIALQMVTPVPDAPPGASNIWWDATVKHVP
jgi:hypothetical protein